MDLGILKRFVDEVFRRNLTVSGNSITVVSSVATLNTLVVHGLVIGNRVQIRGAGSEGLNGSKTVISVPTTTSLTFAANGVSDGADGNNPDIDYYQLDLLVIKKWSQSASPAKPYATIWVDADAQNGFPMSESQSISPTEVNELTATHNTAECELIFYSNDNTGILSSRGLAKYFKAALGTSRARQFQHDNDFGVLQVRPHISADLSLSDIIERREVLEFSVNYVFTVLDIDVPFFNAEGLTINLTEL